ncbi:MAG: hypothetical protein OXI16_14005 [Chloroflexota bacterium]|nr:hypothetical protein [Chloroflexota bacterium]
MGLEVIYPDILRVGVSVAALTDAFVQVVHGWAAQQKFDDKEVNAALDYSRTFAHVFIVGAVAVLPAYFIYLMMLLAGSGGDSRKLEDFRSKFWNLTKGLVVVLGGYAGINLAVGLAIFISEAGNFVFFWSPAQVDGFNFSLGALLGNEGIALLGETIMLQGDGIPVVCKDPLDAIAEEAGWRYVPELGGTETELEGCVKD